MEIRGDKSDFLASACAGGLRLEKKFHFIINNLHTSLTNIHSYDRMAIFYLIHAKASRSLMMQDKQMKHCMLKLRCKNSNDLASPLTVRDTESGPPTLGNGSINYLL